MFLEKSKGLHDDLSEDAITDFVMEACTESSFLLEIVHQFSSGKVKSTVVSSLENWSAAANLINMLPSPTVLVKKWVKVASKYLPPLLHFILMMVLSDCCLISDSI